MGNCEINFFEISQSVPTNNIIFILIRIFNLIGGKQALFSCVIDLLMPTQKQIL